MKNLEKLFDEEQLEDMESGGPRSGGAIGK